MKKNFFAAFITVVCTICCAFGLTACGGKDGNQHTHTYSSEWYNHDPDFHWHAATCEHTTEIKDKSPHVIANGVCTVCGYEDNSAPKVYKTVSFNLNGGEGELKDMQFVVGKLMADLPVPARNGYNFICWEEPYGGEFTAASVMPDRNLTLVAKWKKILTKYSDEFVLLKPATEGCKNDILKSEYDGEVDKFVYVEITSDDLGGANKVGESNNFNLRSMEGMEYKVNSGYTWAWYQGSFDVPNGAQRFTLDYGSNIQFVTISDGDGVVRQTYLIDLYVMRDYYISLYNNIYETAPYEKVRVIENERFPQWYRTPESKFEADRRVYVNSETRRYEDFVYSTAITKNWELYQTYKPYSVKAELNGGTVDGDIAITPYTSGYTLPIPVKEGYDFIGWKNGDGKYLTDTEGSGGVKYLAEKADGAKPSAITVSNELTAVFDVKKMWYQSDCDGVKTFEAIRKVTYKDNRETEISNMTFSVKGNYWGEVYMVDAGAEITVTAGKLGHEFIGWYNGQTKLSDTAEYKFAVPLTAIEYTAEYKADERLNPFNYEATADTLKLKSVKDQSAAEIVVPGCFTEIGSQAFGDQVTSIIIENGVTSIDRTAFWECSNLKTLSVPASVTDYVATYEVGYIENLTAPAVAFTKTLLTNLKTADVISGTSIQDRTFNGCTQLTTVKLSQSLISIGEEAFKGCSSLENIEIPNGIEHIGDGAFSNCSKLEHKEYDNALYLGNTENPYLAVIKCKSNDIVSCDIHADAKIIANKAFYQCASLTGITIPDKVTSIGDFAFDGCTSLESAAIGNNVTNIGFWAFGDCTSLTDVVIPDKVTTMGYSVFEGCTGLENVKLGAGLTEIPNKAFGNCDSLTSIVIPENITSIGSEAFRDSNNLSKVVLHDGITYIGMLAFGETKIQYNEYNNCYYLGSSTNRYFALIKIDYTVSTSTYALHSDTALIASFALQNNNNLTTVIIHKGVKNIGNCIFAYSRNIQRINFDGTVEEWNSIAKDDDWNHGNSISTPDFIIVCTDGKLDKYGNAITE